MTTTTMTEQRATVPDDEELKRRARHDFRQWIDHILERKQVDATHLARSSGLSPSTLLRLLNNNLHPYLPSMSTLRKIAAGSGYDIPNSLTQAYVVKRQDPAEDPAPRARTSAVPSARVYASERGRMVTLRHVSTLPFSVVMRNEMRIEAPPSLRDDETTFAFKVPDDSLMPVVAPGAIVFAVKSRDPAVGDVVLFIAEDSKARVRIVKSVDETGYTVGRAITDTDETISFEEIKDFGVVEVMNRR